jgi:hypothetical protein
MSHHPSVVKGFADELDKLSARVAKIVKLTKPIVTPKAAVPAASRPAQNRGILANVALGAGVVGAGGYGASKILDKPLRRAQWAERLRTGPLGQQNLMKPPRTFG